MKTPKFNRSNQETDMAGKTDDGKKQQEKVVATTTEATASPEIAGTRAPLALVQPPMPPPGSAGYVAFQPVRLDDERKALLKKMYAPQGCSDVELEFFFAFCERTGLDPMLKQAYLVARNAKVKITRNGQTFEEWVEKFEPMASEAGMAAKADGLPDFRGMLDGVVYKGDVFEIDNVAQTVVHKTNPLTRGPLIGAWAHVQRDGRKVPVSYFTFGEKAQYTKDGKLTKFWDKSGPSQLLKCCRAEQWRQGWPNIFGGQFVPEEMREEIDVTPDSEATVDQRDTTDKLAERMRRTQAEQEALKAETSRPGAVSASRATVDVVVEKPKETVSGQAGPATTNADPVVAEAKKLIARCEALKVDYDGQKLLEDRSYREALSAELDKLAKRAVGAISESSMEGAPRNPPVEKKPDDGPRMLYGEHKGKLVSELDGPTLLTELALGESKLPTLKSDNKSTAEQKIAKVRSCIDAIKAEMKKRDAALLAEPGSDIEVD